MRRRRARGRWEVGARVGLPELESAARLPERSHQHQLPSRSHALGDTYKTRAGVCRNRSQCGTLPFGFLWGQRIRMQKVPRQATRTAHRPQHGCPTGPDRPLGDQEPKEGPGAPKERRRTTGDGGGRRRTTTDDDGRRRKTTEEDDDGGDSDDGGGRRAAADGDDRGDDDDARRTKQGGGAAPAHPHRHDVA